ncbi:MAG: prenyltransferase/squalene oxidase repeat-containing protein [Planctomycetota bacterium]
MKPTRRTRILLPALGGVLVLASLVGALVLTLGPTPADRLAEARALLAAGDLDGAEAILATFDSPSTEERREAQALRSRIRELRRSGFDHRRQAIALANARRAHDRGDWVAAAHAFDDAGGGDAELGDEVGRKLVEQARREAAEWDTEEAKRLLELARKTLRNPGEADAAEMLAKEAERRKAELETLLAEARAAAEAGDWALADELLARARRLPGPPDLVEQARRGYEEAHGRVEEVRDREALMAKVRALLDRGQVAEARTLLDDYAEKTGDTSLAVHADALHELERQGGVKSYLPVMRALRWLAAHQSPDGGMHGAEFHTICKYPGCTGKGPRHYDAGLTGLSLMAFTAFTELDVLGEFAKPADRAAKYLMPQVAKDGRIPSATGIAGTYTQAIVALALLERARVLADPKAEIEVAGRIVAYLCDTAHLADGGWRYHPRNPASDTSVTCWVVQALHAAKAAGLEVPDQTIHRTLDFLDYMTIPDGRTSYLVSAARYDTMTPAGLLAKLLFGADAESLLLQASTRHVARRSTQTFLRVGGKRRGAEASDARSLYTGGGSFYLWYYQAYSLRMTGGKPWKTFGPAVEKILVTTQETKGHALGSWDPVIGWSRSAGRIYATAMGALILEVYYRSKAGLAIAPQKKDQKKDDGKKLAR